MPRSDSRWGLQEGLRACWGHRLVVLEELLVADQVLMAAFAMGFVTFATSGFQSCLVCEGEIDEDVAFVDLAGVTSRASWSPLVVEERRMDVEDKATAVVLLRTRREYSTSKVASG